MDSHAIKNCKKIEPPTPPPPALCEPCKTSEGAWLGRTTLVFMSFFFVLLFIIKPWYVVNGFIGNKIKVFPFNSNMKIDVYTWGYALYVGKNLHWNFYFYFHKTITSEIKKARMLWSYIVRRGAGTGMFNYKHLMWKKKEDKPISPRIFNGINVTILEINIHNSKHEYDFK